MKKIFIAAGAFLLMVTVLALVVLWWVGYPPRDDSPGLWVRGELVTTTVSDWSFTRAYPEIVIETRTWYGIPHSVTGYCALYQGRLYLLSAYYRGGSFPEGRYWNRNVVRDPRVRLKIGERVFPVKVQLATDPAVREAVHQSFERKYPRWTSPGLANVHFLRIDP